MNFVNQYQDILYRAQVTAKLTDSVVMLQGTYYDKPYSDPDDTRETTVNFAVIVTPNTINTLKFETIETGKAWASFLDFFKWK